MLDTSNERALFVLGERDDELLQNIPGLTTIGNNRIDLIIASHGTLATQAARTHLGTDHIKTLAIEGHESLPPIRGNITPVSGPISLNLGNATSLQLDIAGRGEDQSIFLATIHHQDIRVILASSRTALQLQKKLDVAVLAVPGQAANISDLTLTPQILVTNTPDAALDIKQPEVSASDPINIKIDQGTISIHSD